MNRGKSWEAGEGLSGRLGRGILFQFRDDLLNRRSLGGMRLEQCVENGLSLGDLAGSPEARGGAQPAAQSRNT